MFKYLLRVREEYCWFVRYDWQNDFSGAILINVPHDVHHTRSIMNAYAEIATGRVDPGLEHVTIAQIMTYERKMKNTFPVCPDILKNWEMDLVDGKESSYEHGSFAIIWFVVYVCEEFSFS